MCHNIWSMSRDEETKTMESRRGCCPSSLGAVGAIGGQRMVDLHREAGIINKTRTELQKAAIWRPKLLDSNRNLIADFVEKDSGEKDMRSKKSIGFTETFQNRPAGKIPER